MRFSLPVKAGLVSVPIVFAGVMGSAWLGLADVQAIWGSDALAETGLSSLVLVRSALISFVVASATAFGVWFLLLPFGDLGRIFASLAKGDVPEVFPEFDSSELQEMATSLKEMQALRQSLARQVEERSHELEVRTDALDAALNAVAIADEAGMLTYVNPAFTQLLGYRSAEHFLGKGLFDIWLDGTLAQHAFTHLVREGYWMGELTASLEGGAPIIVQVSAGVIDSGEKKMGIVASLQDVTDQKLAEEALLAANEELERRVEERTKSLQKEVSERIKAEKELEEHRDHLEKAVEARTSDLVLANEEIRSFAYIVSHDLRAPLVNLKGFVGELRHASKTVAHAVEAALEGFDDDERKLVEQAFEEDMPEAMHFIDSSVAKMDGLINSILKFSRLGRRDLLPEELDVGTIVTETLATMAYQVEEAGAEVTIKALPSVIADRFAVEQIFANLLSNAIKYLDPARPGKITIDGGESEDRVIFRIKDNGRGIAEADLPKIFEIFRRVGPLNTEGEGMGLAYVKTLLRRHGGSIECLSTLGEGTTFTIGFPLAPTSDGGE